MADESTMEAEAKPKPKKVAMAGMKDKLKSKGAKKSMKKLAIKR